MPSKIGRHDCQAVAFGSAGAATGKFPDLCGPSTGQKTYEPAATSANTACVKTMRSEVAFAEIPLPAINPVSAGENGFRPDITIQTGSVLIGVSNTASDALLGKLLEVIGHAR